jgi:hypothetical protein
MSILTTRTYDGLIAQYPTSWYAASGSFAAKTVSAAADRYKITAPVAIQVDVNGVSLTQYSSVELDLSVAGNWDAISPDYTVAATRAGKDFYLYSVIPTSGSTVRLLLSANATYPSGFTALTSRKIGGFHCLCVAAGTLSNNALTGYLAGDILPASVWDLKWRATPCGNEGMVYDSKDGEWKDIYPPTSTGANTASIYATATAVTVSRNWMDFTDDGLAIGKHLLRDAGFQSGAAGSNEETNIAGSAFPAGTGGYSDTAGRRMISSIGMESCCGHIWQWLDEQSNRSDAGSTWAWYDLAGSKGSLYTTNSGQGDVKLLAGGYWYSGAYCGSRSRYAYGYRWSADTLFGARFAARHQAK